MTHGERLEIAGEVAGRILEKYGEQVSAIAVYGSVAKGEDATHSDLDLWVATATDSPIEDVRFFVYKRLPVSVNWDTEVGRIESARRVTPSWPLDADELRSYLVLFERGDFLERLREAAARPREEEFVSSMRVLMVRLQENSNKVLNARNAGDHYRLLVQSRALVLGTAMMLGLLNRRYYAGGRGLYVLSKQMPRQPKDYGRLLDDAGGFATIEPEVVYKAAVQLWANLCELIHSEGLEWEATELPI
jgi:kanamycin nucleotidyltransferase